MSDQDAGAQPDAAIAIEYRCMGCEQPLTDRDIRIAIDPDSLEEGEWHRLLCPTCHTARETARWQSMGILLTVRLFGKKKPDPYWDGELARYTVEELRYLARTKFGHQKFTAETFELLFDWLRFERGFTEQAIGSMSQGGVCELLQADRRGEEPKPPAPVVPPIIASRGQFNVALGVSRTNGKHLEKLHRDGELTLTKRHVEGNAIFGVVMTDPEAHRRLKEVIDSLKGRKDSK